MLDVAYLGVGSGNDILFLIFVSVTSIPIVLVFVSPWALTLKDPRGASCLKYGVRGIIASACVGLAPVALPAQLQEILAFGVEPLLALWVTSFVQIFALCAVADHDIEVNGLESSPMPALAASSRSNTSDTAVWKAVGPGILAWSICMPWMFERVVLSESTRLVAGAILVVAVTGALTWRRGGFAKVSRSSAAEGAFAVAIFAVPFATALAACSAVSAGHAYLLVAVAWCMFGTIAPAGQCDLPVGDVGNGRFGLGGLIGSLSLRE
jgi:hypothetical protein